MSKVKQFQLIILAMIVIFILFPFMGQTSVKSVNGDNTADQITIQLGAASSRDEMPGVDFKHDLHTAAVDGKCESCHKKKDDAFVFKFKRTDEKASMDLYHNECIACHLKTKVSEKKGTGPKAAECRVCHVDSVSKASSWTKLDFDKSLHFIHESSSYIKGMDMASSDNCSACHHQYNEKTKEIFFTKGEEESCFYCHKPLEQDKIRPIRDAAHDSCVKCHQTLKAKEIAAGPVTCDACHEQENQLKIKKVADVPRLKRSQPDEVAITGWKKESQVKANFMDAVAFDHKSHEANAQSCKVCHHETLKKCSDCHTTEGGELKGGFVSLGQAMHKQTSAHSCVGCHKEYTKNADCAGCHFQAPAKKDNPESCRTCHSMNPSQLETGEPSSIARKVLSDRTSEYKTIKIDKIPETIEIGALSKDYKPSSFPHGKVVKAISQRVEKSNMAKAFHTDQAGLCMGCHHNSPKTLEPPKCASCHSKNGPVVDEGAEDRPGLKGAYHGQCITCHQKMEVQAVQATDCVKCHEEKK